MGLISAILFGTFFSFFGFWAFKTRSWRDFQPVFFLGRGILVPRDERGDRERKSRPSGHESGDNETS